MTSHNIGDRERDILHLVQHGYDDFHQIRSQLTLSWRQLDYSLEKLEDAGLVATATQDGYVTREVDGQERTFPAPRRVAITDRGSHYLAQHDTDTETRYEDLDREELVDKIHDLEDRIERLETGFKGFRKQVRQKLEQLE